MVYIWSLPPGATFRMLFSSSVQYSQRRKPIGAAAATDEIFPTSHEMFTPVHRRTLTRLWNQGKLDQLFQFLGKRWHKRVVPSSTLKMKKSHKISLKPTFLAAWKMLTKSSFLYPLSGAQVKGTPKYFPSFALIWFCFACFVSIYRGWWGGVNAQWLLIYVSTGVN